MITEAFKKYLEVEGRTLDAGHKVNLIALATDLDEKASRDMKKLAVSSIFLGGWRPFLGWVAGVGALYEVLIRPLLNGGLLLMEQTAQFPRASSMVLELLLGGALGIVAARSWDKKNGVDTKSLR